MNQIRTARRGLSAIKGIFLLVCTDLIGGLFVWAYMPGSKDIGLAGLPAAMLAMFGSSYLLFFGAWRASQGENLTRLEVVEDIIYNLLAIKGGLVFGFLFILALQATLDGKNGPENLNLTIGVIALSGLGFLWGVFGYVRRLRRASDVTSRQ